MGSGAYAEYVAIAEAQAVKVPAGLSWSDGAIIEPVAVGLHGAKLAHLDPDDRVLVIGAGPIALGAVFWARRMGAGNVVVMASTARRKAFAELAVRARSSSPATIPWPRPSRRSAARPTW